MNFSSNYLETIDLAAYFMQHSSIKMLSFISVDQIGMPFAITDISNPRNRVDLFFEKICWRAELFLASRTICFVGLTWGEVA